MPPSRLRPDLMSIVEMQRTVQRFQRELLMVVAKSPNELNQGVKALRFLMSYAYEIPSGAQAGVGHRVRLVLRLV